jgi:BirA family biotin operon repressor/biotin-[acetyl-CoA-carboxylase] ligase
VVVGVGVDVNLNVDDFPAEIATQATSLKIESGKTVVRVELAAAILRALDHEYGRLLVGEFENIADEWEKHCTTLGQRLVIVLGDRRIGGRAESLDDDGALMLRTEHGRLERIVGGDVLIEK